MLLRPQFAGRDDINLSDGTLIIGRAPGSGGIVLPTEDSSISRKHAELQIDGDTCKIRDLGSRNGTLVNGMPVIGLQWMTLSSGDRIQLCNYEFRLLSNTDAAREKAEPGSCIMGGESTDLALSESKSISLSRIDAKGLGPPTQLRALLGMTEALRDALSIETMITKAVAILLEIFPTVERAAIGFINDDREFQPTCWQFRHGQEKSVKQISRTIANHVLDTCEAIITNDAYSSFADAQSVHSLQMRSVMCAPIVGTDRQAIGLIHLDTTDFDRFNDLDLELLASVATQLSLAVNFSRLHAAAVEDAVLRHDVEKAREVQSEYLPSTPKIDGYDLEGFYRAARHVGGDYFDFVELPDGRLAMVLGDVIGKGVPAALTMVRLATETRASLEVCDRPAEMLTRLNQKLSSFITIVIAILDPQRHTVVISNAGHEPPLFRAANGNVDALCMDTTSCPLSVLENEKYEETTVRLSPGESLVLFTDGFPDAESLASDTRFGKERIIDLLKAHKEDSDSFVEQVVARVDAFVADDPQFDDMCMIYLRRQTS